MSALVAGSVACSARRASLIRVLERFAWIDSGVNPEPWREGESLYAMDGAAVIRVAPHPDAGEAGRYAFRSAASVYALDEERPKHGVRLNALINQGWLRTGEVLVELPELPAALPCASCSASGRVGQCPSCDNGLFEHAGHDYECRHCHGTGRVKQIDGKLVCKSCRGTGAPMSQAVAVGVAFYSRHYLALVQELPGVEIGLPKTARDPLYFQCRGYDGLFADGLVSAVVQGGKS